MLIQPRFGAPNTQVISALNMIQLLAGVLQRGTKVLLESANLTIYPGQKWGIIGPNGSGKSTLFQVLLGDLHVDGGQLEIPRSWEIAHMAQEVATTNRSALDYVMDGDTELRRIQQQLDQFAHDGTRVAELYSQMEVIDGYTAQTRAQKLLHGLGFSTVDDSRQVSEFSGGWRIRLNLARALMCRSDCLLLDEPTNHLDLDAALWLENHLKGYGGTLLIISHDRDFLDNVVEGIVSIENARLVQYRGNYSAYERQKAERIAQQTAAFEKQQVRIAEIEDFVRRFRAKATKAKQAQSRLKELARMETLAPAHMDSPFNFRFPVPDKMPQQAISLDQATIGYPGKSILAGIELSLLPSSRIGLLGANGAGKSTLLKTLAGRVPLQGGKRTEGTHLKIGYFAQHQLEALDLQASCALHLQRIVPKASEQEIRNFLGGFDFHGERVFEPIRHFSGGEKARLALAILAWHKPNLLLMDEPTNHLDLEVRHALSIALQTFDGPVVLVSHDRHLLRNTVDEFFLVDQGRVEAFEGDLDDYQTWLLQKEKLESLPGDSVESGSKQDKKGERQAAAALRDRLKPQTQQLKKLEKQMDALDKRLKAMEERLASPEMYDSGNNELPGLLKEQAQTRQALEELEQQWLEVSEQIEQARIH